MVSNEAAFEIVWEACNDAPWCSGFYYINFKNVYYCYFSFLLSVSNVPAAWSLFSLSAPKSLVFIIVTFGDRCPRRQTLETAGNNLSAKQFVFLSCFIYNLQTLSIQ